MLHERLEDTLDWLVARCGFTPPPRPPRALRAAVRALASEHSSARLHAEHHLRIERNRSMPLLRQAARQPFPVRRAVRAALLLHGMDENEGIELLRRMVREPEMRLGEGGDLLKQAVGELVGSEPYLHQANSALVLLEQRPESFRAINRYRQALEILRFLEVALPIDIARRALVVRTIGGENLSLVRMALTNPAEASLEHVCQVRKETIDLLLEGKDRRKAYSLLVHTLLHPSTAVQLTAIYGLERLGDTHAMGHLAQIARDPNSPVADDARRVIAQWDYGYPDVFTLLRPANIQGIDPGEMLRPVETQPDVSPATLLRVPDAEAHREIRRPVSHNAQRKRSAKQR